MKHFLLKAKFAARPQLQLQERGRAGQGKAEGGGVCSPSLPRQGQGRAGPGREPPAASPGGPPALFPPRPLAGSPSTFNHAGWMEPHSRRFQNNQLPLRPRRLALGSLWPPLPPAVAWGSPSCAFGAGRRPARAPGPAPASETQNPQPPWTMAEARPPLGPPAPMQAPGVSVPCRLPRGNPEAGGR